MFFALAAAGLWGTSAYVAGLTTRRVPAMAVVWYSQAAGLVLLGLGVLFWPAPATAVDVAWGAVAGAGAILALASLYHGLAVGRMSVVSPLAALIAVTTPATVDVVRGTPPTGPVLAGLAVAAAAIVLLSSSTDGSQAGRPTGLGFAVMAGLGFAVFLIALDQASPAAGLWPLVGTRLVSAVLLGIVLVAARRTALDQARTQWPALLGIGVIEVAGAGMYFAATSLIPLTAAVVLSSLHPLVTVLWARLLLHEQLGPRRLAGIAGSLVAIVLVAVG